MTEEVVAESDVQDVTDTGAGLLEMAPAGDDTPSPAPVDPENTHEVTQDMPQEWHWADGMKGEGDRPEWLKDRYKSVADQAAAYTELEKKFGEFRGAPKDGYSFDDVEGLDADSPMLQKFSETFKELGLSQEGFNKVVSEFVSSNVEIANYNAKEELKKLGPQGPELIKQTNRWIANNLPPEVAKVVDGWIQTADDLKAFDTLRAFQPLSRSPSAADMTASVTYETSQDVINEKTSNWDRYKDEPNYRKNIQERLNNAIRREAARNKR